MKLHAHGLIERHLAMLTSDTTRRFLEAFVDRYGDGSGYSPRRARRPT